MENKLNNKTYDRSSEKGFSLAGVTVAASVASFVMLAMAQMIQIQMQSASFIEDKLAKIDLKGQMMTKLADQDSCRNTFANLNIVDEQKVGLVRDKDNNVLFDVADPLRNKYDNLQLDSILLLNNGVAPGPNQSGDMRIQVNPIRTRGNPIYLSPFDIAINVTTNALGRISDCKAYGGGGGGSGALDEYDSARDCANAPTTSGGMVATTLAQMPPKNANGKYDEGSDLSHHCPGEGPTQIRVCINGSWRNLSAGPCTNRK